MSWPNMSGCSWQHWEWGSGMKACITLRCIWRLPVWVYAWNITGPDCDANVILGFSFHKSNVVSVMYLKPV